MRCAKCGQPLRCTRCGTVTPEDSTITEHHALTGSISEELQKRCVIIEISRGVMRHVLLLSDVEEILARMNP